MPRHVTDRVPAVTMLFGPSQLRPSVLLDFVVTGFGRWLATHAGISMPRMLTEHRAGVVVRHAGIDYRRPDLAFAGTDWLTVHTGLRVDADRKWIHIATGCLADHGATIAECHAVCRVVRLGEGEDLAARPGPLPDELADRFTDDDLMPFDPRLTPRAALLPEGAEELVPRKEWTVPILRSHCETADQWSFVAMVDLAGQARERLYSEGLLSPDVTMRAIAAPVRTIRAVFRRPMFVFDHCRITTSACVNAKDETVFRHQFGPTTSSVPHLTVVETLDRPTLDQISRGW